jgi:hypothetical protein
VFAKSAANGTMIQCCSAGQGASPHSFMVSVHISLIVALVPSPDLRLFPCPLCAGGGEISAKMPLLRSCLLFQPNDFFEFGFMLRFTTSAGL